MGTGMFRVVIHQGIREGQLETFKRLAQEQTAGVEAHDPGTLAYEWYIGGQGTDAWVLETYADSDALLSHRTRAWQTFPSFKDEIAEVGPVLAATVFGSPNTEAREELSWLSPDYVPLFIGCTH
jgi:quinol monooxygenase YgiN